MPAEWTALGDRAIRAPRPPGVAAAALIAIMRRWPGVVDVVISRDDVAAYFATTPRIDPTWWPSLAAADQVGPPVRSHVLHARYDGADLAAVARAVGLTPDEVVARHLAATYVVDAMGFMPGFGYLRGLDPALRLPRRATPRPWVPAGALAIADDLTAVYPTATPGGWHLIGSVDGALFDPVTGARLGLGDQVRFALADLRRHAP